MSNGPIEYLHDKPSQSIPATEYGGADGLIQPEPHQMTASEARGAITRAAMWSDDDGPDIVDPLTGRVVPPDMVV